MRGFYGLVFAFCAGSVFGQVSPDTLGLTGGMADTVVANRLLGEMKYLVKERKWDKAEAKGLQAKAIYVNLLGEECRQVADVWHQNGLIGYYKGDYKYQQIVGKKP